MFEVVIVDVVSDCCWLRCCSLARDIVVVVCVLSFVIVVVGC